MPPGFNFTINVILLNKYCRSLDAQDTINRYPNENAADILTQATYWKNIHGYVGGGNPNKPSL